jgi:hypothetical protein
MQCQLTVADQGQANIHRLTRALAPYLRRVAVSDGLRKRSMISACIVSGPCASFAILAMHVCHVWLL